MIALYIILAIIVILFIYSFIAYNSFIESQNRVKESFSTMDVYLKKRWDLVPNLVETVKTYANYENNTLTKLTSLRSNYNGMPLDKKINANEQLVQGLASIMAIAENYPELKANNNFLDLSKQLTQIENDIANARKYYNACVRDFNIKVQTFPSNLIAKLFNFQTQTMFEADADEKENVKVDL